jgi:hypothetical protein
MIPTKVIREALIASLKASELFQSVTAFNVLDLSAALRTLRDSPDSAAIVVPGRTTWEHEMIAEMDESVPTRAESRAEFNILLTLRDLRHGDGGNLECVDLVDDLAARLIWTNLAVPGLLCLPDDAEPFVIEIDDNRGREAWKIQVTIVQQIIN